MSTPEVAEPRHPDELPPHPTGPAFDGLPAYNGPPDPRLRTHTTRIILIVVAATTGLLLICGLGLAAIAVSTAGNPHEQTATLSTPDRIGTLRRTADDTVADKVRSELTTKGYEHPYAVSYDDAVTPDHTTIVWGGTGSIFESTDRSDQLDELLTGATTKLNATATNRINVKPLPVDGVARCAEESGTGLRFTLCVWSGYDALLGFMTYGLTEQQAAERLRTLLAAIVTKN